MPRTKSIQVFKYEELSDSAKQKAIYEYAEHCSYPWTGENQDTLKEFESIFPIKVKDWSYDTWSGHVYFEFTEDDTIADLSGVRLLTYIHNNYYRYLIKGKYYSTYGKKNADGTYRTSGKNRYSKVIFNNDCVLTGYGIDYDILDPIYTFLKKPDDTMTFHDLMNDCLQSWATACARDMEHYYSEESFIETAEANEWEFHEDGSMA